MLLVSFTVSLPILGFTAGFTASIGLIAALVALAATILETLSFYGLDNLTVPLGSAVLAYGLMTSLGLSVHSGGAEVLGFPHRDV